MQESQYNQKWTLTLLLQWQYEATAYISVELVFIQKLCENCFQI